MFDKNLLGNNISDIDKDLLAQTISKIDLFFAKFGVNIDYDNSRELFENLKIEDVQGKQNYVVSYDETSNTIKQNFENPDFSPKRYEAELIESLLNVLSQKLNFEEDRYDKGLLSRDTNFRFHGFALNDMLAAYIGTLITGYNKETDVKDFYLDSPKDYETIPDRAIHDFCEVFGAEFLLKSFINADGSELFYKVGETLGSEENAVDLYNSMDSYNNNSIANRRIYDLNMEELKEKMLENKPKM